MNNTVVKILATKKTKSGSKQYFKIVTPEKEAEIPAFISSLKKEKKTFKTVENTVEKTFTFNGNNYIVTSKKA